MRSSRSATARPCGPRSSRPFRAPTTRRGWRPARGDLSGDVAGTDDPKYLENVVTSSPLPGGQTIWTDPLTQACVKVARKAYPSDHINDFNPTFPGSKVHLDGHRAGLHRCRPVHRYRQGGGQASDHRELRQGRLRAPQRRHPRGRGGSPSPPDRPFALGPVYMVHYDATTKTLVFATKSST